MKLKKQQQSAKSDESKFPLSRESVEPSASSMTSSRRSSVTSASSSTNTTVRYRCFGFIVVSVLNNNKVQTHFKLQTHFKVHLEDSAVIPFDSYISFELCLSYNMKFFNLNINLLEQTKHFCFNVIILSYFQVTQCRFFGSVL